MELTRSLYGDRMHVRRLPLPVILQDLTVLRVEREAARLHREARGAPALPARRPRYVGRRRR